jgi:hypothetical protein
MKKLCYALAFLAVPALAFGQHYASPTYQGVTILGTAAAPTASPLTNSGQIGTTGYTDSAVGVEKSRAQVAESTNATAINSEASRAQAAEALRLSLSGGAMMGALNVPTVALTGSGSTGDVSGMAALATGSATPRTLAARAADVFNVKDYGAKGDDATDDTAAINATEAAWSAYMALHGGAKLVFPGGTYRTTGPMNFTDVQHPNAVIDAGGSIIDPQFNGGIVFDALGSRFLTVNGLSIIGSSTYLPAVGLAVGVVNTTIGVADTNVFNDIFINGYYSVASAYNRSSETSLWEHPRLWNKSTTGYTLVEDGINHFNVQSTFQSNNITVDSPISFNENTYIAGDFREAGGMPAIWLSATRRHTFLGGYIGDTGGSGASCGAVVYSLAGVTDYDSYLWWDVHEEAAGSVTDQLCFDGTNTAPVYNNFTIREMEENASNSIFKVIGSATSPSFDSLNVSILGSATSKMFDAPSLWTVSGQYNLPTGSTMWNLPPGSFQGEGFLGATALFYGNGTNIALPSNLQVSEVSNPGSVSAITLNVVYPGRYWLPSGASFATLPQPTIASPPSGGQQATANTTYVGTNGATNSYYVSAGGYTIPSSGGVGCSVNDVLTLVGGTSTTTTQYTVAAVGSGGSVTELAGLRSGFYTATPAEPIGLTGGTCTTEPQLSGILWFLKGLTLDAGGGGYLSPPTVAFPAGYSLTAQATTTIASSMLLQAGGAQVSLTNTGTNLGVAGTAGSPVVNVGALVDGSGVRVALTTSGYTVPPNTSLVRFTQASTVASAPVSLPIAEGTGMPLADGHPIQFVNYAGPVTALTFSPAVNGWTNGSSLAAYTGIRIRWDETSGAWYREQ